MQNGNTFSPANIGRRNFFSTTPSKPGRFFHGFFSRTLLRDCTANFPCARPIGELCFWLTKKAKRGNIVAPCVNEGAYGDSGDPLRCRIFPGTLFSQPEATLHAALTISSLPVHISAS